MNHTLIRWIICCSATLLALSAASCATTRPEIIGADGYQIDSISFEGVTRFSDSELLEVMYSRPHSWVPFSGEARFDDALAFSDIERITALYRAYGYFQAEVTELKTSLEGQKASLLYVVNEGPLTRVATVDVHWLSPGDEDSQTHALQELRLEEDDPFETGQYNQSLGAMRQSLQNDGYPLAEVTGEVQVRLAQGDAQVQIFVAPGERARIGAFHIDGLVHVPHDLVLAEVEFVQGAPYSPARLRQVEAALRAMRVFRWVSAEPEARVVDGEVAIAVQVSEADPHEVRVGVELSVDSLRWQEHARLNYTHTNLFSRLTRLDLTAIAGWAQLPNPWAPTLHGPVASLNPKLTQKGLLERHLLWSVNPSVEVDLEEGYQYFMAKNRFGISRWFLGHILLGVGQNTDYVDFFNLDPALDERTALLGRDFRDPYLLSSLELNAAAYYVDQISAPTNGIILSLDYNFASKYVLSDFDFHKTLLTLRGYLKPGRWLQLATRLRAGSIYPFGEEGAVPFNQRFYLGGATSVRGWGSRRLSPRIEECTTDPQQDEEDCSIIPIGGYTMVQGNLEARIRLIEVLWLVGFLDVGDVRPGALQLDLTDLNYSAGPGLRAITPLGTARLDLGFRLNDTGRFSDEQMWGIYFGLGQAL